MAEQPHKPVFKSFVISPPVRKEMEQQAAQKISRPIPLIVTVQDHPPNAKSAVKEFLESLKTNYDKRISESQFYVFAQLTPQHIEELAERKELVYHIWKDEKTYAQLLESTETIKATACWKTFEARGKGITWAVLDSGIKADHPHFAQFRNVDATLSKNFSNDATLDDELGHGTHVAGIIAGIAQERPDKKPYRVASQVEESDEPVVTEISGFPSGVAPMATLVNAKVLDKDGTGSSSAAIRALEYLRTLNDFGRSIKVDGVNMSLGYPFDPQWYGCGYSPLCEEVRRAVRSGMVVVVSCGNSGYGSATLSTGQVVPLWIALSITDPANTDEAIAVGSVHKSAPHSYGISYFSSKGPTGDGRMKPDLVAPGEKIISCAIEDGFEYKEESGTSMAAPHVSGAIAAFLSARKEFRGKPELIKQIFRKSATDLGRDPAFQGTGLVDLFRALTSV